MFNILHKGGTLLKAFFGVKTFIRLSLTLILLLKSKEDPEFLYLGTSVLFAMASVTYICVFLFLISKYNEETWLLLPCLYADWILILFFFTMLPVSLIWIGTVDFLSGLMEIGECLDRGP